MLQHQIDDLRRAAQRAGRGEYCLVNVELLLELISALEGVEDARPLVDPDEEWEKGYDQGYEEGFKEGLVYVPGDLTEKEQAWAKQAAGRL